MRTVSNLNGSDDARGRRIDGVKKNKRNRLTSGMVFGVIRWISFSVSSYSTETATGHQTMRGT